VSQPVEAYFAVLRDIHASGAAVAETSYYGPLATLLDEVGKHLKPKVRAIINLRNTGAGIGRPLRFSPSNSLAGRSDNLGASSAVRLVPD
jgi:hypothetical protein